MTRKRKQQKNILNPNGILDGTEFELTQEVLLSGTVGEPFDLILRFDNTVDQPQLFMDEMVKIVLEDYIKRFGKIIVRINWFSKDLHVIAPEADSEHALQGTSEALQSMKESNP